MSDGRTVAIIGGGVIGLCSAWYALREGYRVILVERGARDHDCCSLGNSGLVVPSHFIPLASPGVTLMALQSLFDPTSPLRLHPRLDPDYLRWCWRFWRASTKEHVERSSPALRDLALLSLRCYGELADEWHNPFGLQKRGLMMLSRTRKDFEEEAHTAELAKKLGIDAQVLEPEEAQRLEPTMRMSIAGAVVYPADAHLTPQVFVSEITRRLEDQGVDFLWSTEALGWRANGQRVQALRTTRGEVGADEFLIAGGVWSMQIAEPLGLRYPLEAGKGYNMTLRRPRAMPSMSAILNEARIAVTPMGETLRFAGTLQLAGIDLTIDERRVQALIEAVPEYYPEFATYDFDGIRPWAGLRPCSPDGLPYIGRARPYENVLVAAGHAMMGISLGPGTGMVVSEVLAGRRPSVPLEQFAPDRFA